jgi:hypothetical protein
MWIGSWDAAEVPGRSFCWFITSFYLYSSLLSFDEKKMAANLRHSAGAATEGGERLFRALRQALLLDGSVCNAMYNPESLAPRVTRTVDSTPGSYYQLKLRLCGPGRAPCLACNEDARLCTVSHTSFGPRCPPLYLTSLWLQGPLTARRRPQLRQVPTVADMISYGSVAEHSSFDPNACGVHLLMKKLPFLNSSGFAIKGHGHQGLNVLWIQGPRFGIRVNGTSAFQVRSRV